MSLQFYDRLSRREQGLFFYVMSRIGPMSAIRLARHLLGDFDFEESMSGERNSIQVWAQENFGFSVLGF